VKLTFWMAVLTMAVAGVVMLFFRQDYIHCIANINYIRSGERFSLIVSHDMRNGHGVLSLAGRLTGDNQKAISLSKIIRFNYHRDGDLYLAQSTLIEPSPDNQMSIEQQEKWLPAFFITVGATFPFVIKRTGIDTWVFYSGPVPLFICEK